MSWTPALIRVETHVSWHNRVPVPAVDLHLASTSLPTAALVGAGDPDSSRIVYGMVIGLVVIGVMLILLAVWIIRQTRPDLEVLAPLERMGDSDWKKKDPSTQRRILDELRPEGAEPLVPASRPPSIDADFEQSDHPVTSFSDLGPGVVAETRDPTPAHTDFEPFGLPAAAPVEPHAEGQSEPEPEPEPAPEPEPEPQSAPQLERAPEVESKPEAESATATQAIGESDVDAESSPRG